MTVDLKNIGQIVKKLPKNQQEEMLDLIIELEHATNRKASYGDFLSYVRLIWPAFIEGSHHRVVGDAFNRIASGDLKRLIIAMAPRHTKSEFASHMLPSWILGKDPTKKIIQASNKGELAVGFGRKVRNTVASPDYSHLFPGVSLAVDSKAAGRWNTNKGGEYFAVGVGGMVTGRGADLLIIDDPHALTLDTEIPTPDGFRTMEEVRVGDFVFGPDGKPTEVTAKSDVYHNRPLCEVVTSDGEVIHCDGEHLWSYGSDTKVDAPYKVAAAGELVRWRKANKPCLPRHEAVQYLWRDLLIPPYVLGAWLGDGTSSLGRMTADPHGDDFVFMKEQFDCDGYETTTLSDSYSFGVLGLRAQLRDLGVLDNKHIPEIYLIASLDQRLSLLQGLMDTDGTVTIAGQCSFQNTNYQLVAGVKELVHSFGVKARINVYVDNRELHGSRKPDYRVNFKMKDAARMPRKRDRTYTPTDKRRRSIEVRYTDTFGSVQCLTVAREDGLFLVGRGYVVTHNSEQEAAHNSIQVYDAAYEWYTSGPRQRLQPRGAIVIVATRWHKRDLIGQILKASIQRGGVDEWEIIELPVLLDEHTKRERPIWPEFWDLEELRAVRAELPVHKWSAQFQQNPTSEEGALVKREWWQEWTYKDPPKCEFIIQSWDTAFLAKETADYSACTTWGVWRDDDNVAQIILLDALQERLEFPDLKKRAYELYMQRKPDAFIVESKAAGTPLIFELRRMGIPVQEYKPNRGNDKVARVNSVADLFSSGFVWAPKTRWAEMVQEDFASFPYGEHDDLVDSGTQALLRFRQGGFIALDSDEKYENENRRRRAAYY